MHLNRRTFQQLLFLAAGYQLLPVERYALAIADNWNDLAQPFGAQVQRLLLALNSIGDPLPATEASALQAILSEPPHNDTVDRLDTILQRHVLLNVDINPESLVSVTRGAAKAELVQGGWRNFLIRVTNQAKDTSVLQIRSPLAAPMGPALRKRHRSAHDFTIGAVDAVEAASRWISISTWDKPPLQPTLSDLGLEYRILQIYSRDHDGSDDLHLDQPAEVRVTAGICARLDPDPGGLAEKIRHTSPYKQPYWHLERSRISASRKVPVQLIVNGESVQRREIEADGSMQEVSFQLPIHQSSWLALRVLPSSHTNTIHLRVAGQRIRASKKSAAWCRQGVDVCWKQKTPRIRPSEIAAAKVAYDRARAVYDRTAVSAQLTRLRSRTTAESATASPAPPREAVPAPIRFI